jgi:gliding motility-associated-like protein
VTIKLHLSAFVNRRFNLLLMKIGYFNTKNFRLKRFSLIAALILPALTCFSQGTIEFVENKGQWNDQVLYMGKVSNGSFFIRKNGFTVVQYHPGDFADLYQSIHDGSYTQNGGVKVRGHSFNVDFVNASGTTTTEADKPLPTYTNYFIGSDQSKWGAGCRVFQAVTAKDVYPNVDVRFYTDNGFLKYDIIARPGADISRIALKYDGVDKLSVKNKNLVISTSLGDLNEALPYSYQASLTGRSEVNAKYSVKNNIVRFDVKDYDPKAILVIDPQVVFCSFSGSTADNWGFTATYGPDGSMFGGGIVFGSGFPTNAGAFQTNFGGDFDIGVIKLTPDGSNRVYATYLGGTGREQPQSLIVDGQGNLVIAGRTNSVISGTGSFPLKNGSADMIGQGGLFDIIIVKLNAAGNAIIGSKRIGGSENDGVNISENRQLGTTSLMRNYGDDGRSEVILDGAGNVYVASCTQSTTGTAASNFPAIGNPFQSSPGGSQDGVLIKLTPDLGSVLFASYLGGNANDAAYVLSISPAGEIYVAGGTESGASTFPGTEAGTLGPDNHGSVDGFVAVISGNGSTAIRSTFLGTDGADQVYGIQFDNRGFPYAMGQTTGDQGTGKWPVTPGTPTYGSDKGKQFIVKMQPDLSSFVYSTVFGTGSSTPNISPVAFLVDRCENVYISGWGGYYGTRNWFNSAGTSGLPVTSDAIKPNTDGKDFYFFVLKKDAVQQLFGSFFGEDNRPGAGCDHVDGGTSRFDKNGVIYQAICANCNLDPTVWPRFPTTAGSWAPTNVSNSRAQCNLAMVKIAMNLAGVDGAIQSEINGVPRDTAGCVPLRVVFRDTIANAVTYEWDFGDGSPIITTTTPDTAHTYTSVGLYRVRLIAIDPNTCNVRDTSYLNIRVGDLQAALNATYAKLPPCTAFKYQFNNLSATNPIRPFTDTSFLWIWGDGSPVVVSGLSSVTHTFPSPGLYKVKLVLKDTAYCNNPDTFNIDLSVAQNVKAAFITPPVGCLPYTAQFDNTTDAGETWQWDFGDGGTSTDFEPSHDYTAPGRYVIKLIATNPNTCNVTDTAWFTINVFQRPIPGFTFGPDPPVSNTPTTFLNTSFPEAVRFKWVFGDGDSLLTASREPVQHQYNSTGTFNACLTAYNAAGCDSSVCQQVRTLITPLVDVPNAFTPLSGDANSIVYVRGFGIGKIQFIVWNRWGQKVFETNNRNQGWDGKVKGVVQPMDVYVYTLNIEFTDGTKTVKKGDITLIR